MEEILIVKKSLKEDKRNERRRKYIRCKYCNKFISKYNYSKHYYRKHSQKNDEEKTIKLEMKKFIKNTNKILDDLSNLKILLTQVIKIKINKRKFVKKIWYKNYKESIKELTKLLEKKNNNNNEEENNNNDKEGEVEVEVEESNNNDDDVDMNFI